MATGSKVTKTNSPRLAALGLHVTVSALFLVFQLSMEPLHADAGGSYFDDVVSDHRDQLNRMAASGDGQTYYTFSYVLESTLAQYEGTHDRRYLEQVLAWGSSMIAAATISDIHGRRNWSGRWQSPYATRPIAYQLQDLQAVTALARAARLIIMDDSLRKTYALEAAQFKRFVEHDVVDKILEARGSESWFRQNAADPRRVFSDKTALLVRLLLDIYRSDGKELYRDLAVNLLAGFKRRLVVYKGDALIWDVDLEVPDTSHANRMPYMVVDAYESGIVIDRSHIDGLARLLTEVIWDQSTISPQFANFVNGGNERAFGRGPWGNGQIYSGWLRLGRYDQKVQLLGEMTLRALMRGSVNPSLGYMNTVFGKLSLAGHLARNRRLVTDSGR